MASIQITPFLSWRAPDFASLRPLLLPFEAAVYGGRVVTRRRADGGFRVLASLPIPTP